MIPSEDAVAITCLTCGTAGVASRSLPVVVCPTCDSTIVMDGYPPAPEWIVLDVPWPPPAPPTSPAEPVLRPGSSRPGPGFAVAGWAVIALGLAFVFAGGGTGPALPIGAAVGIAGLAVVGWWGLGRGSASDDAQLGAGDGSSRPSRTRDTSRTRGSSGAPKTTGGRASRTPRSAYFTAMRAPALDFAASDESS